MHLCSSTPAPAAGSSKLYVQISIAEPFRTLLYVRQLQDASFSLFPQIFSERTFFSYVSINFVLKNSVSQRGPQKSKLDSYVEIRTKYVQLFSSTFHQPKNVQKLRRISTRNYGSTIVLWWARKNAMSQRPPSIQKKKRDARSTCPRTRARPKWPRHERASSRNAAPIATASRPM